MIVLRLRTCNDNPHVAAGLRSTRSRWNDSHTEVQPTARRWRQRLVVFHKITQRDRDGVWFALVLHRHGTQCVKYTTPHIQTNGTANATLDKAWQYERGKRNECKAVAQHSRVGGHQLPSPTSAHHPRVHGVSIER